MSSATVPEVLVVQHEENCPPGHLAAWAERAGAGLVVVRAWEGEELPGDLTGYAGLLVLGGSMDAYSDDRHPWLGATKRLVREAVEERTPLLGVCLGHQIVAVALGGEVEQDVARGPHEAVSPVVPTLAAAGDPLASTLPEGARLTHWNGDVVTQLPAGSEVLTRDGAGRVQVVRFAERAWGVQGHPEVDHAILASWGATESDPAARERQEALVAEFDGCAQELHRQWAPVAEAWFGLVADTGECADE